MATIHLRGHTYISVFIMHWPIKSSQIKDIWSLFFSEWLYLSLLFFFYGLNKLITPKNTYIDMIYKWDKL